MSQAREPVNPGRPPGPLVWFHTGSALPGAPVLNLTRRLERLDTPVAALMTTTATLPPGIGTEMIRPAPPDRAGPVRGFLDRWRPDAAVWTECDLRPALINEAHGRGLPMFFVDAGGPRADHSTWRWRLRSTRHLLGRFEHLLSGDAAQADEMRRMGAPASRIEIAGPLQEAAPPPVVLSELDDLSDRLAARPIWLAAAVSGPEEIQAVTDAHRRGVQRTHRLLLVLCPADASTGPALAARLMAEGWIVALRSAGEEPGRETQIYVADTEDEMGLWYRLSPISYLGGTLEGAGGPDPFDAAALGSAILHGPNVRTHRSAYARLANAGATRPVSNAVDLSLALEDMLSPDVAAKMAQEAWRVSSTGAEVTDRIIGLLSEALEARGLL